MRNRDQNVVIVCIDLVELVTDYFEGALSARDRRRFEEHLSLCEGCTRYVEQLRTTVELTGTLDEDDLDPVMRDALLEAFRGWRSPSD
jgi:anti-sigma factor RsiW